MLRFTKLTGYIALTFYIGFGVLGISSYYHENDDVEILWFANAYGPNDPECFELGTCDLFGAPFEAMIEPFNATLTDFTLVAIWAIIMGVLWLRVSNTMVVGVMGIALASLFTQGFSEEAQIIGWALLGVAITVALYQILIVRTHFPTN